MKPTALALLVTLACSLLNSRAAADYVSITYTLLPPPPVMEPESPLLNLDRHVFFVSTDSDILSVGDVRITSLYGQPLTLHQEALGHPSNAEPPNPALVAAFPALAFDSWITTPGDTIRLGADMPGDGITTFGDLQNHGPQQNFQFAQLALPRHSLFQFEGTINILSTSNPGTVYTYPFLVLAIPEPATLSLVAGGLLALAIVRRRDCRRSPR